MKIKLISDTHFEFYEDLELYKNNDNADVLVIAGDLNVGYQNCWSNLKRFADTHARVIYVPGNHEYYGTSINEFDDYIKRFSRDTNIHFLNPGTQMIDDVTFIGAALWTNFSNNQFSKMHCSKAINDFRRIRGFNTDTCTKLNTEHTKFLKEAYLLPGKKVFVTHFLPDKHCIAEQYRGDTTLNDYFANDLGDWIQDLSCSTWLFGHSHTKTTTQIGQTRVFAHPYGYNYNKDYKIEIFEI